MDRHESMPAGVVAGWTTREETHPPGERVDFHYHRVEEWLEVVRGGICFFTVGARDISKRGIPVSVGQALRIPPGEVHRAEIGPEGVNYRMWMPRSDAEGFTQRLQDDLLRLIEENLALPEVENRWELRNRDEPGPGDRENEAFLRSLLSPALTFRTVMGSYLDLPRYLARPAPKSPSVRSSSGTVQILHAGADSLLLSTVVETRAPDGTTAAFTNARLFVREDARWKLRVWLNAREPGAS